MVGALKTSCPSNRLSRRLNQLRVSLSPLLKNQGFLWDGIFDLQSQEQSGTGGNNKLFRLGSSCKKWWMSPREGTSRKVSPVPQQESISLWTPIHPPDSAFYLVFPVAPYVSYPPWGPKPPRSEIAHLIGSGKIPGTATVWLDEGTSLIFNQVSCFILLGRPTSVCAA